MINPNISEDVRKVIFPKGYDNNSSFQRYADPIVIGNNILSSLMKKRKKNKAIDHDMSLFYTDARNQDSGFLSTVYGCTGLISLVNRFGVKLNENQKAFLTSNIIYLLEYVEENKYTLNPYIDEALNEEIFINSKDYIGSMTWMISLLTSIRAAITDKTLVFENNDEINEKIKIQIKYIIKNFIRYVNGTLDNPKGWGFTKGAEPSLFFTYSVLEAYSDFEDNICPPCPIDANVEKWHKEKWDNELLEYLGYFDDNEIDSEESNVKDWKTLCENVAMNVWNEYKSILKTGFACDSFWDATTTVSKTDILKSNSSNALFNNIYLVFILIFGYVNQRVETTSEKEDVIMTMNAALQNVQRMYEQLNKEGYGYIVDSYIIQFGKCSGISAESISRLNYEMLVDAKITPTLVKANNMVAFYITQYPVKEMGALFENLFANIKDGEWVWDNKIYDIKNTERYIEAIADFYLYYDAYEKRYVQRIIEDQEYERSLSARMKDELRSEVEHEVRSALEEEHKEEIKAIKAEYRIENAIISKIQDTVLYTIKKIVQSQSDANCILSECEEEIAQEIEKLFHSFDEE